LVNLVGAVITSPDEIGATTKMWRREASKMPKIERKIKIEQPSPCRARPALHLIDLAKEAS